MNELAYAEADGDIEKIADAIGDCVYVLVGTAVVHGIPFDEVLAAIHASNMTKTNVPGVPKLVKGDGYRPPDIAGILARKVPAA